MSLRWRSTVFAAVAFTIVLLGPGSFVNAADYRVETWEVDGGTTGLLVRDSRAPIVQLRVEFPAGSWSPWFRREHGDEAFRIQLHDAGGTLRARADAMAATLVLEVAPRHATLHAAFLTEDLDAVLALVRDVLANDAPDRRELRRWKKEQRFDWDARRRNAIFRAEQEAVRRLFAPGDPRRSAWERPDPVSADVAHLVRTRDVLVRLPGRTIGFAGDLDRERAERAARGLLPAVATTLPADLVPAFHPSTAPPAGGESSRVSLSRLTQVYLVWARESPAYGDPDYPAFLIADHVLGGHFHSRLYTALRHDGGDTYGVWTSGRGDAVSEPYRIVTFTRTDNVGAVREKLQETLAAMQAQGPTDDERRDAAGHLLGRQAFDRRSPAQPLARRMEERRLGLEPGALDALVRRAAETGGERIDGFVRGFYDPASFVKIEAGAPD